ncbi:AGAP006556-PA-like protein [Anopheles sinensis]|uniref:AGAP006556-PA-like protein n=1 Tax=Anopheles sinensis TaxID=74873 RepID=A0A084WMP6_ANOSI|nr:AGAP006556-PA-like protein [Anopheles sinensis]
MKSIIAFALLVVCLAQIAHSTYAPCAKKFFYTSDYPVRHEGYPVDVVDHVGYYPYPYAGHQSCKCSKCYPPLYTQQYRDCKSYF